ncbi:hypothetical protein pb186bvf_010464 [Paramecium bursaria]
MSKKFSIFQYVNDQTINILNEFGILQLYIQYYTIILRGTFSSIPLLKSLSSSYGCFCYTWRLRNCSDYWKSCHQSRPLFTAIGVEQLDREAKSANFSFLIGAQGGQLRFYRTQVFLLNKPPSLFEPLVETKLHTTNPNGQSQLTYTLIIKYKDQFCNTNGWTVLKDFRKQMLQIYETNLNLKNTYGGNLTTYLIYFDIERILKQRKFIFFFYFNRNLCQIRSTFGQNTLLVYLLQLKKKEQKGQSGMVEPLDPKDRIKTSRNYQGQKQFRLVLMLPIEAGAKGSRKGGWLSHLMPKIQKIDQENSAVANFGATSSGHEVQEQETNLLAATSKTSRMQHVYEKRRRNSNLISFAPYANKQIQEEFIRNQSQFYTRLRGQGHIFVTQGVVSLLHHLYKV